ncbi:Cytochrome P450 4V2 [Mactra antiquata]
MAAVTLILVSVFICVFSYFLYRSERIRRNVDRLGGPKSLPILGNVHQLSRSPVKFTKEIFSYMEQFCHLPAFRILIGSHPIILVCCPKETEQLVNSSKHLDKSSDYDLLQPWLGTGLLLSTGEKWKTRRKLLTPTFHFKILHDFVGVFNEQCKILVNKWKPSADGRTVINVYSDITTCALDIICETAMGRNVNAQQDSDSDYVKAVHKVSQYTVLRVRSPWYWPTFLFNLIGPGKDYKHGLSILHSFTEQVIRERQEEFSQSHDKKVTMQDLIDDQDIGGFLGKKQRLAFLDMLLCTSSDGRKLSFSDIREEVDTFMFEGHDTTAMASSWATHLIGADPDCQRKVHEELDAIFGDSTRDATMDDLKEMKYLECCIKEALRIYPSVPVFGRSLTEDATIAGVDFPKGTSVLIAVGGIHLREDIYPEPEKFDPDRFLPENCVGRHPYAFIPFSAGGRNCIGQKFALLEEKTILSSIFRAFTVKSMQEREDMCPLAELILRPGDGVKCILTPRNQ